MDATLGLDAEEHNDTMRHLLYHSVLVDIKTDHSIGVNKEVG